LAILNPYSETLGPGAQGLAIFETRARARRKRAVNEPAQLGLQPASRKPRDAEGTKPNGGCMMPALIMRSSDFCREFSCVQALFALFLLAPISLNGQSGSPPQSQPVQPAGSAATGSPAPADPLIERAREAAFEFSKKLPNFVCLELMSRFVQQGRQQERLLDRVSAEITYEDGQESYRNVKLDDRPTDKGLDELGGSWSTGEFASTLLQLFHPDTDAQFRSGGASPIAGSNAQVYDFQVRSENSHWKLQADSQTVVTAYEGSVWVDPSTARVLRIEIQARNLPSDFAMDSVESAVDYSYVTIGENSFLLPVHAESLGCKRATNLCSHNIIDFRNYHEFKSEIRINTGPH